MCQFPFFVFGFPEPFVIEETKFGASSRGPQVKRIKNQVQGFREGSFLALMSFGLSFLLSGWGTPAQAVNLSNRLGVGYSNQWAVDLPALTARYYPTANTGVSLALGMNTETNHSRLGVLAKVYHLIFTEEHLNFYGGGGVGLVSSENLPEGETKSENQSGVEVIGVLGTEFFFTGLESLGFIVEVGIAIRSDSRGTLFRTMGDHPLRGGIIFYF